MAITVKKSAAPKTLRVAPRSSASVDASGADAGFGDGPSAATPMVGPPKRSYTVDIVLGCIGCLVFAALIAVQLIEWAFYEQPPQRAFPLFQATQPLTLMQQWGAAPLGIQMAIILGAIMLVMGIVSLILAIVRSVKARSSAIA